MKTEAQLRADYRIILAVIAKGNECRCQKCWLSLSLASQMLRTLAYVLDQPTSDEAARCVGELIEMWREDEAVAKHLPDVDSGAFEVVNEFGPPPPKKS